MLNIKLMVKIFVKVKKQCEITIIKMLLNIRF